MFTRVENGPPKFNLENFSKITKAMRATIHFFKYDGKTKVHGKGLDFGYKIGHKKGLENKGFATNFE